MLLGLVDDSPRFADVHQPRTTTCLGAADYKPPGVLFDVRGTTTLFPDLQEPTEYLTLCFMIPDECQTARLELNQFILRQAIGLTRRRVLNAFRQRAKSSLSTLRSV